MPIKESTMMCILYVLKFKVANYQSYSLNNGICSALMSFTSLYKIYQIYLQQLPRQKMCEYLVTSKLRLKFLHRIHLGTIEGYCFVVRLMTQQLVKIIFMS